MAQMQGAGRHIRRVKRPRHKTLGCKVVERNRNLEPQRIFKPQIILHEFETVGFQNDVDIRGPAQQARIQQLPNAAIGFRQAQPVPGKIAQPHLFTLAERMVVRHHTMQCLAHGCCHMHMRHTDRLKDQRDIGIQRIKPCLGIFAIATLQIKGYSRMFGTIMRYRLWQELPQRVCARGDAHMAAPDAGQIGNL